MAVSQFLVLRAGLVQIDKGTQQLNALIGAQPDGITHRPHERLAAIRIDRVVTGVSSDNDRFRSTAFGEACRDFLRKSLKVVKYDKALGPTIELVTSLAIVFALYVAVVRDVHAQRVVDEN